ncbi:MAG: molybdate ABC transporter substrate-binding protein [Butyricicoccus sp.]
MKKRNFAAIALAMTLTLAGCGSSSGGAQSSNDTAEANGSAAAASTEETVELNVFAAASMQETLEQIVEDYKSVDPSVEITLNLDSSGTLKTQIEEGAECDIFISAAQLQMNQLDAAADESVNTDGLDFVDSDSRVDLLENKVVLVVPEGNPKDIQSFEDIAEKADLIALGNDDVPVGQYSKEILNNLGVMDELEADSKITYGSNVKEVTTQVTEGTVDCGIVYETDAFSAGLESVDSADADQCSQAIYPAAVMKNSANPDKAQAFLDYLKTDDAGAVFESVGFQTLS